MSNEKHNVSIDLAPGGLLTIAFIVLKLCHVINWSWVWVLAPTWIPLAFALTVVACFFLAYVFTDIFTRR